MRESPNVSTDAIARAAVEGAAAAARLRDRGLDVRMRASVGQDPRALARERRERAVADRRRHALLGGEGGIRLLGGRTAVSASFALLPLVVFET